MADDSRPVRSLLVGLVTLVLVALIIGGVVSLFALGAANVAGLASGKGPAPKPSLYVPPLPKHTGSSSTPAGGPEPVAESPTLSPSSSLSPTPADQGGKHRHRITLNASPLQASVSQRIDLSGRYPGGNGAVLQVQNRQGGQWTDFPVTVTVSGSAFHTYIYTGNPGPQRFRVVDPGSGRASNTVTVTIS